MDYNQDIINAVLGLIIITDLTLLAAERQIQRLRIIAFQGAMLGSMPILMHSQGFIDLYIVVMGLVFLTIKAVILPYLLYRTYRHLPHMRPTKPYLGNTGCILAGLVAFALALWLNQQLGLSGDPLFNTVFPAAFTTMITGLLLIVTRKNALTQVFGYLTIENGIYLLGVPMASADALWLELTILLDILVGVFVMGIAIHHIHREFDSTDVNNFSSLKG